MLFWLTIIGLVLVSIWVIYPSKTHTCECGDCCCDNGDGSGDGECKCNINKNERKGN